MRKYIGYIPAVLFTAFYLMAGITGASITMSAVLIWLICFWISGVLFHKGVFWGGIFGLFPALHMIYMGTQYTGQVINIEIPLGIALLLFYVGFGFYLWRKKDTEASGVTNKEVLFLLAKVALTIVAIIISTYAAVVGGMILISEGVHQVLAYIFKLASEGSTITQIALILNKEGVPTPSLHMAQYRSNKYKIYTDWTWNSVKNIIENRIYTGDTEPFKSHVVKIGSDRTKQIPRELREVIPETHEAIVSRELYYLAQTTIKSTSKSKGVSQRNPLTSRLICGCCGNTLGKGKAKNKNWLCSRARYNDALDCKNVRADEETIKGVILRAIQQQCSLTDVSFQEQRELRKATKSERTIVSDEIRSLQRKLDKLQNTKRELLEAVMEDRLSREDYVAKKKSLLADEESITAKLAVLQLRLQELSNSVERSEQQQEVAKEISQFSGITELTPEVMKALVKRVIVYPDNHVRIEWNFSDNLVPFTLRVN